MARNSRRGRRRRHPKPRDDGFRSEYEARVARFLEESGHPYTYEDLRLTYDLPCVYIPDFVLLESGVIVEAKGYFPPEQRRKMQAVGESQPDLDIRLLFQDPSKKINSGSRTTYGDWADRHGWEWAVGPEIPEEWFDE